MCRSEYCYFRSSSSSQERTACLLTLAQVLHNRDYWLLLLLYSETEEVVPDVLTVWLVDNFQKGPMHTVDFYASGWSMMHMSVHADGNRQT